MQAKRCQVHLNGPKVMPNGPKSKLGLPRVTTGLDKSLNLSLQGGSKKVSSISSYGSPRNYCKVLNKYLIGHVIGRQN